MVTIVEGYRYKKIKKGASKVEFSTSNMIKSQTENRYKMVGKIGIEEWNALETLCLDCYTEKSIVCSRTDWKTYKRLVGYRCSKCGCYVEAN